MENWKWARCIKGCVLVLLLVTICAPANVRPGDTTPALAGRPAFANPRLIMPVPSLMPVAEATGTPASVLFQTTNITQADYAQALAKWNAVGVSEYIITVDDETGQGALGRVQIHVRVVDGTPQVIGYIALDLKTLAPDEESSLPNLTVEAQFRLIAGVFNGEVSSPGTGIDYTIQLDPVRGYPTKIQSHEFYKHKPIPDAGIDYSVVSLRILRSRLPGMPKTGHPRP